MVFAAVVFRKKLTDVRCRVIRSAFIGARAAKPSFRERMPKKEKKEKVLKPSLSN